MSQEKKPDPGKISPEEMEDALQEIMLESAERHPTGELVSLSSIVIGDQSQEEARLLAGATRLHAMGKLRQEGAQDASKLYGELDSKGNLSCTFQYADTGEEETILLERGSWQYIQ